MKEAFSASITNPEKYSKWTLFLFYERKVRKKFSFPPHGMKMFKEKFVESSLTIHNPLWHKCL